MTRSGVRYGRWLPVGALMAAAVLLAACSGPASDEDAGGGLALNLASLEAETDVGTLRAEPVPHSYVAAVDDDLFIAVALEDGDGAGGRSATVYLCDGAGVSVWLSGEVAPDQPTRLGGFEDGASVEFVVAEDAVHGHVVTAEHGGPQYFEAVPASGEAGLYRAEDTLDGEDYVGGWIVLDDGRQQGQFCIWVCVEVEGTPPVCQLRCLHLN